MSYVLHHVLRRDMNILGEYERLPRLARDVVAS